MFDAEVAVLCCSLNRPQELQTCLESLRDSDVYAQVILLTERGSLAALRNRGLRQVRAPVVVYVDDDLVAPPGYLRGVLSALDELDVVGCTGPSIIPQAYRKNRVLYRSRFRFLYDRLFVRPETRPGHLTSAGTFVPDPDWSYEGPVQFIEACHMAFKTEAIRNVGGFDEAYGGIGDWSEPDLCYRLRQRYGDACLQFHPALRVEHRCAAGGATLLRRQDAQQRLANYKLFTSRWVRPSWQNWLYQRFLEAYYVGQSTWR